MISDSLKQIADNYIEAKKASFNSHPLARSIRHEIPHGVSAKVQTKAPLKVYGSAGQSKWADCPWVALLDERITTSTQEGIYLVYLFSTDMSKIYLSLNQGITRVREGRKKQDAIRFLKSRALSLVSKIKANFKIDALLTSIDLNAKTNSRSYYYECGNVLSIQYDPINLPPETDLEQDLNFMLEIYSSINYAELSLQSNLIDQSGLSAKAVEDYTATINHMSIDRKHSKKVKELKGYICECCGIDMEEIYGFKYIEAHHKKPISSMKGQIVDIDLKEDFAVLCPNCHVAIHKQDDSSNIELLKQKVSTSRFSYFATRI